MNGRLIARGSEMRRKLASTAAASRLRALPSLIRTPLVDTKFYKPSRAGCFLTSTLDFLLLGAKGVNPHPLFDTAYYLATYPHVVAVKMHPLVHFILFGAARGYNPHPLFDTRFYLENNPDIKGINPLEHYITHGWKEGRDPHRWFDVSYYIERHADVRQSGMEPLTHFLAWGADQDRCPHPDFDTKCYKERFPEIYWGSTNPLVHFINNWHKTLTVRYPFKTQDKRFLEESVLFANTLVNLMDLRDRESHANEVNELVGYLNNGAASQEPVEPKVSIIIPIHNQILHTLWCLRSLRDHRPNVAHEIIVIDDKSKKETAEAIQALKGIVYVQNEVNLGFLRTCNRAAQYGRGTHLVFLNNDTYCLPHWLDELYETFKDNPHAGLVGSKLLYPDARLQEAGGYILSDGSAGNYGRNDDPNKPEYNYLREVSYISGASIMVRKDLFDSLGGFDEQYIPAYCEDSDLAFAIRELGYKTLYQPLSRVVHFEGVSSGTNLNSGVKRYQVVNSQKFSKKWQRALLKAPSPSEPLFVTRDLGIRGRMLVIDAVTPTPDQDAGSLTAVHYMKIFREWGYKITFIPEVNLGYKEKYTRDLQRIGIECLYEPYVKSVEEHLALYGRYYDVVMLYRANHGTKHLSDVRYFCPQAKVIYDTVDLHYLRKLREVSVSSSSSASIGDVEWLKNVEFETIRQVDHSIVVSQHELDILATELPRANVSCVPLVLDIPGRQRGYAERRDICFIGGFQHSPNIDAMLFFVRDIWPLIKEKLPHINFYIIGSHPSPEIQALAAQDIIVTGYVEDLALYLDKCLLSVAPLRIGAGIKGKIGSSLSHGLPCVASLTASEGMDLRPDEEILVAETPQDFAQKVVQLYTDPDLWLRLSDGGLKFVSREYSVPVIEQKLATLFATIGAPVKSSAWYGGTASA
jgi:GT2 family glycosyltransferase/glycosyltransferase involved in cell wall biosynthesis